MFMPSFTNLLRSGLMVNKATEEIVNWGFISTVYLELKDRQLA